MPKNVIPDPDDNTTVGGGYGNDSTVSSGLQVGAANEASSGMIPTVRMNTKPRISEPNYGQATINSGPTRLATPDTSLTAKVTSSKAFKTVVPPSNVKATVNVAKAINTAKYASSMAKGAVKEAGNYAKNASLNTANTWAAITDPKEVYKRTFNAIQGAGSAALHWAKSFF